MSRPLSGLFLVGAVHRPRKKKMTNRENPRQIGKVPNRNKKDKKGWETDFYTPPVLGGAALLPFSAPAVYKNPVP